MLKLSLFLFSLVLVCHGLSVSTRNLQVMNSYYVYTRDNPWSPVSVSLSTLSASPINISRPTVFMIHGHGESGFTSLNPVVKDAMLTAEDVNIIVVDWSVYATLSYSIAAGTVPVIAEELATFIQALVAVGNKLSLDNTHIVGFNLGAHVAGITGRLLNSRVARITGLDPSGSQWGANSARLRITDALYVEVIHTDGSGLLNNGIGTALGHVDFFANGGSNQPGCLTHACSHNRAYELFAASMINLDLVGYPCSSNTQLSLNLCRGLPLRMGGNELSKIGAGTYRVNTKRTYPF